MVVPEPKVWRAARPHVVRVARAVKPGVVRLTHAVKPGAARVARVVKPGVVRVTSAVGARSSRLAGSTKNLTNLQTLYLWGCEQLTDAGIAVLQNALPKCSIPHR